MRSYYQQRRWAPAFTAPAQTETAAGKPARRSRKGVVLFTVSLTLILALVAVLAVVTWRDYSVAAPDPAPSLPGSYETPTAAQERTPPSIPQAELGSGVTLELVSPEERPVLTLQENYQKNIRSIVGIHVYGADFGGSGTGIILSEDGYLLTNAHVVARAVEVVASLYDGSVLECDLVGFDPYSDLAVLKIYPDTPLVPAEFGDSDTLQAGDTALALGNPMGAELWGTMTDGIISAINRDVEMTSGVTMTLIQTSAAINSGNSGGALLNDRGQVIGVTNMKMMAQNNTIEGLGFAIPSTTAKAAADAMIARGRYEGTPSIGITGSTLADAAGVTVRSVNPKSDAYALGVQTGDIVTAVNGTPVHSVGDINALKEGLAVGDTLTLTLLRGGRSLTVTVTLVGAYDLR